MPRNTSNVLGDHFDNLISRQVQNGRYASASEVVRVLHGRMDPSLHL